MTSAGSTLCRLGTICGTVAALLSAGCASSDLSKNAETTGRVIESLPTDAPAPSEIARATWFPNARGFGSTDASQLGHVMGVLVLSGDNLYFMWWNAPEHHYDVYHVVDFMTAASIKVGTVIAPESASNRVEVSKRSSKMFTAIWRKIKGSAS